MNIGALLLGKVGAIAGFIGCAVLALLLVGAKMEVRHLNKTVEQRDKQITALNRDLGQARTNVTTLQSAINERNDEIRRLSEEGKARLNAAEKKVAAAQGETRRAEQRARDALAYQPKGNTAAERMLDVDRKFVESLK